MDSISANVKYKMGGLKAQIDKKKRRIFKDITKIEGSKKEYKEITMATAAALQS